LLRHYEIALEPLLVTKMKKRRDEEGKDFRKEKILMDILHSTNKLVRHAIFSVASLPHFYENLLIQETHDCDK
jgi:hypothetical protein